MKKMYTPSIVHRNIYCGLHTCILLDITPQCLCRRWRTIGHYRGRDTWIAKVTVIDLRPLFALFQKISATTSVPRIASAVCDQTHPFIISRRRWTAYSQRGCRKSTNVGRSFLPSSSYCGCNLYCIVGTIVMFFFAYNGRYGWWRSSWTCKLVLSIPNHQLMVTFCMCHIITFPCLLRSNSDIRRVFSGVMFFSLSLLSRLGSRPSRKSSLTGKLINSYFFSSGNV